MMIPHIHGLTGSLRETTGHHEPMFLWSSLQVKDEGLYLYIVFQNFFAIGLA